MEHGFNAVVCEHAFDRGAVRDIRFNEGAPLDGLAMPSPEIVDDNWLVAGLRQGFCGMAADVAGAACDQYVHVFFDLTI
jgi:hypothetical protein